MENLIHGLFLNLFKTCILVDLNPVWARVVKISVLKPDVET